MVPEDICVGFMFLAPPLHWISLFTYVWREIITNVLFKTAVCAETAADIMTDIYWLISLLRDGK